MYTIMGPACLQMLHISGNSVGGVCVVEVKQLEQKTVAIYIDS